MIPENFPGIARGLGSAGCFYWVAVAGLVCSWPSQGQSAHEVSAATIHVKQIDSGNAASSIRATIPLAINSFHIEETANRGDLDLRIGDVRNDDEQTGVLISSVAENGRDNFGTNNYPISAVHAMNSYRICTYVPTAANAGSAAEYNVNVAAAWFPYGRYLGGVARNSTGANGGTNNVFVGSPGLAPGTHLRWVSNGVFNLDLRSLGVDSRTDGVLLVNHARDENNFALSQSNGDGTWQIYIRDNAQPTYTNYEQDPLAFVFVPKTNTALVSGKFNGDGSIVLHDGAVARFAVANVGIGRWELRIPGYGAEDGVLIISPEGGGRYNGDNIVSYAPLADGSGWEIQSRDTPNNGLQTPIGFSDLPEPVASFVFIPAARAALLSPKPGAWPIGASPQLAIGLSNVLGGAASVSIFAREVPTPPIGPDFMVVALPDTQYYTAERFGGKKEMFYAQTEWAITNRSANVAYVAHLGDISDSGDIKNSLPNTTEWRNATNAMYRLEDVNRTQMVEGMPYGMAVGNHDQEPIGTPGGTSTFYNEHFGISHFLGRHYYGGHYGTNNDNHYDVFSASGLDFLVVYFEYDTAANPEVLGWADGVLKAHPQHRAIAVTHYMGSARTPSTHSAQGAAIYNALKDNTNLFLLLGGHVTGEGSRSDIFNGNTVRTFISDYQGWTNGGNGFMRLMTFSPSNNTVTVQTYSPWVDAYETDADSEFFFSYNLQRHGGSGSPGTPWMLLANANLQPGELLSARYSGLTTGRTYEWYATVTDRDGNTSVTGSRQFVTGPNVPPWSSNTLVYIQGDEVSDLQLIGKDANEDALTYRMHTLPTRGLVQNFDTNHGTFAYVPTRGYRGSDRIVYQVNDGKANSTAGTFNMLVESPPDINTNGLADGWESAYGVSDPSADPDGDGQTNLEEYQANTNPTNAQSVLRIDSAARQPDGSVTLNWSSVGGTRYRVLYSDFTEPGFTGVFTELVRDLVSEMDASPYGFSSSQSYTDNSASTNAVGRVYKIRVSQ